MCSSLPRKEREREINPLIYKNRIFISLDGRRLPTFPRSLNLAEVAKTEATLA